MEKTVKIFFACAAGAGIGSVVALQFITQLWWLGMLAGGLAGYVLYDLRAVIGAVKTAWLQLADFTKIKEASKSLGWLAVGIFSLTFTVIFTVTLGLALTTWFFRDYDVMLAGLNFVHVVFHFALIGIVLWLLISFLYLISGPLDGEHSREARELGLHFFQGNPFSIYFYWLPKGIFWLLRRLPGYCWKGMKIISRFVKTVFILIHSSERLLCMVYAAIGVAVFHFTGNNILLGMLAGGVLGVVNYEIVSVRLKLTPR